MRSYYIVYFYKGNFSLQYHYDDLFNIIDWHISQDHKRIVPFTDPDEALNYLNKLQNECNE